MKKIRGITSPRSASAMQIALSLLAVLVFLLVYVHLPLALKAAYMHDDGLFIKLGSYIANGQWLGPFDQLTLAKGPGYPIFLALNEWLGTSVALLQALLFAFACIAMFACISRIFKFPTLSTIAFIFTIFCPILFFSRILRDTIYPSQLLIILSLALSLAFIDESIASRLWKSIALGLITTWFFLTREEGIWIVPAAGVLIVSGIFHAEDKRRKINILGTCFLALLVFIFAEQLYKHLNKHYYGYVVGVDIKEKNFVAALDALQSVQAGKFIARVPVSHDVRVAVSAVSPTFASISGYFDPPGGTPWQYGCQFYRDTCGDIAGGWFIWALRDAAASKGHYQSPRAAADFFGSMASEIKSACASGKLKCTKSWVPYMPRVSSAQIHALPASILSGIRQVLFSNAEFQPEFSEGDGDSLPSAERFLGYPPRTLTTEQANEHSYVVRGWFLAQQGLWLTAHTQAGPKQVVEEINVPRESSPDLVTAFGKSDAAQSRFNLEVTCETPCALTFSADGQASAPLKLSELAGNKFQRVLGGGVFNVDEITKRVQPGAPDLRTKFATDWIAKAVVIYSKLMKPLVSIALVAIFASIILRLFVNPRSIPGPIVSIPVIMWILIVTRLILLALIDVSAFPAMYTPYLSPLFSLTTIAVSTSIMSFVDAIFQVRCFRMTKSG